MFADDNQLSYAGYKGRLRTTMVALVANGLRYGQAECFSIYRGSRRPPGY